jgi:hypothetical protein
MSDTSTNDTTTDLSLYQFPVGVPVPSGLDEGTDLVLAPLDLNARLAHFDDRVYDLSPDSHLFRYMAAILGDAGVNQLRKQNLLARLGQTLQGTSFFDLDRFYGSLFGLRRGLGERLSFDPRTQQASPADWVDVAARDGSYRSRIEQFGSAVSGGGTTLGLKAVAEAVLAVECDIVENWAVTERSYRTYEAMETDFATYDDMEDAGTWGDLEGELSFYEAMVSGTTYGEMEGGTYEDLEEETYGSLSGTPVITSEYYRNRFTIIPRRTITPLERHDLLRVINRLKPVWMLADVTLGNEGNLMEVDVQRAWADSEHFYVRRQGSRDGFYMSGTNEVPIPGSATRVGDQWSYLGDLEAVGSYIQLNTGAIIDNWHDLIVWNDVRGDWPRRVEVRYEAYRGLRNYGSLLRGFASLDGNVIIGPSLRPTPEQTSSVDSSTISEGVTVQSAQSEISVAGVYLSDLGSGGLDIQVPEAMQEKVWATPPRAGNDTSEEALEFRLTFPRRINYVHFDLAHYPQVARFQAWDQGAGEWQTLHTVTLTDSVPTRLGSRVDGWVQAHPQHSAPGHWVNVDIPVTPVVSDRFRVVVARLPQGHHPMGANYLPIDYSLAVRRFDVGYRIHSRLDIPRSTEPLGSIYDLFGNRLDLDVVEFRAQDAISASDAGWRSEPKPAIQSVINYYLDVRDENGDGQVLDRIYLDPITPGVTMNVYHSQDEPVGSFDPDETRLGSDVVQVEGTIEATSQGLVFPEADPARIVVAPQATLWNPERAWWVGMHFDPTFDSSAGPYTLLDLGRIAIQLQPGGVSAKFIPQILNADLQQETYEFDTVVPFQAGNRMSAILVWQPDHGMTFVVRNHSAEAVVEQFASVADLTNPTTETPHPSAWDIVIGGWSDRSIDMGETETLAPMRLRSLVLKDRLSSPVFDSDWTAFLDDPASYPIRSDYASEDDGHLSNAVLRFSPFYVDDDMGLIGGPGEFLDAAIWTPIPRDFRLQKGYFVMPPVAAKYVKLEFTNLVPESLEQILPTSSHVKSHPRNTPAFGGQGGYQYPPGMSSLATVGPPSDAVIGESPSRATVALFAQDPSIHERLRQAGIPMLWKQFHLEEQTTRGFPEVGQHIYAEADLTLDKLGYYVGLWQVRAYRQDYTSLSDTEAYYERFHDGEWIEASNWDQNPGSLSSGNRTFVEATSKTLPSKSRVWGLQFATQQSEAVQIVPDDKFQDPALSTNTWEDPNRWHRHGDATVVYDATDQSVLNIRDADFSSFFPGRGPGFIHEPFDPTFSYIEDESTSEILSTEGGIESPLVLASEQGMVHAAVRFTALTNLTNALTLQIVASDGTVVAEEQFNAAMGETVEGYVSYVIGSYEDALVSHFVGRGLDHPLHPTFAGEDELASEGETGGAGGGSLFRVRLIQSGGAAQDRWKVRRLSFFDESITWEFSVDGGETFVPALGGVRNNPHGAISFPEPADSLVFRVRAYRGGLNVNALQIRPWYEGQRGSQHAYLARGGNVSEYDDVTPVEEDPDFKRWYLPVPRSWWIEGERYTNRPLSDPSRPVRTPFARFLSRGITETLSDSVDEDNVVLSRFDALYQAKNFAGVDGDPWLNEGNAGSDYDAISGLTVGNPGTSAHPHYVSSPEPGFEITNADVSYYLVPDGPGIEPGTGSFTVFGRFYWPSGAGAFDNIFAKIQTPPAIGSGGRGWQVASGSTLGPATLGIIANGGSTPGTDPVFASDAGNLSAGEHLVVLRLDRDTDAFDMFIDGTLVDTADASTVPDVTAAHEWIFGRGKTQTNRAYGLIMEALTDDEITVDLPAELERTPMATVEANKVMARAVEEDAGPITEWIVRVGSTYEREVAEDSTGMEAEIYGAVVDGGSSAIVTSIIHEPFN